MGARPDHVQAGSQRRVWRPDNPFHTRDGLEISAPLEWFPRLRDATPAQRTQWRLIGKGVGGHWPEFDEDIAVGTLMRNH